jgi:(p)ppGpp synthase/HD superfamily hydrolase
LAHASVLVPVPYLGISDFIAQPSQTDTDHHTKVHGQKTFKSNCPEEMHQALGAAAHFYSQAKNSVSLTKNYSPEMLCGRQKMVWVKELADWKSQISHPVISKRFKVRYFIQTYLCFFSGTSSSAELSTPVDYAFSVHTNLGFLHFVSKAMKNCLVDLCLKSGDVVKFSSPEQKTTKQKLVKVW